MVKTRLQNADYIRFLSDLAEAQHGSKEELLLVGTEKFDLSRRTIWRDLKNFRGREVARPANRTRFENARESLIAQAGGRTAEGRAGHSKKSRGLLRQGPAVMFGFIAHKSECIKKTIREKAVYPGALFRQETCIGFVLLWPCKVDFTMGRIDVAANNQSVPTAPELSGAFLKGFIEVHFVAQPLRRCSPVWVIDRKQDVFRIFGNQYPPLAVKAGITEAVVHFQGLLLIVDRNTAVAFFFSRAEPAGISVDVEKFFR